MGLICLFNRHIQTQKPGKPREITIWSCTLLSTRQGRAQRLWHLPSEWREANARDNSARAAILETESRRRDAERQTIRQDANMGGPGVPVRRDGADSAGAGPAILAARPTHIRILPYGL